MFCLCLCRRNQHSHQYNLDSQSQRDFPNSNFDDDFLKLARSYIGDANLPGNLGGYRTAILDGYHTSRRTREMFSLTHSRSRSRSRSRMQNSHTYQLGHTVRSHASDEEKSTTPLSSLDFSSPGGGGDIERKHDENHQSGSDALNSVKASYSKNSRPSNVPTSDRFCEARRSSYDSDTSESSTHTQSRSCDDDRVSDSQSSSTSLSSSSSRTSRSSSSSSLSGAPSTLSHRSSSNDSRRLDISSISPSASRSLNSGCSRSKGCDHSTSTDPHDALEEFLNPANVISIPNRERLPASSSEDLPGDALCELPPLSPIPSTPAFFANRERHSTSLNLPHNVLGKFTCASPNVSKSQGKLCFYKLTLSRSV